MSVFELNKVVNSFTSGQLSRRLGYRVDLAQYAKGVRSMQNFTVLPHGPLTHRPGTYFIKKTKDSATSERLVEFIYSTGDAYILEFSPLNIRIFRNGAIVLSASQPVDVATPYTAADIANLTFVQNADFLYIFCPGSPGKQPRTLARNSDVSWTLALWYSGDGPYLDTNVTSTTLQPSAKTGTAITITASADVFAATDVNRVVRIQHATKWGCARITAVASATSVTANVDVLNSYYGDSSFEDTTAVTTWRLGTHSDTTGWPSCGVFYSDRFILGGSSKYPNTFWVGETSEFVSFRPSERNGTVVDTNGFTRTFSTNQVNSIVWFAATQILLCGTSDGIYSISSGNDNLALTPTNVVVHTQSRVGANAVRPIVIGDELIYVSRTGRKVYAMQYSLSTNSYHPKDLTIFSEDSTRGIISYVAYQEEPDHILWFVTKDFKLYGMTYVSEQEVIGFHRHVLGGKYLAGEPQVMSVAVVTAQDRSSDVLYMIVRRTIDGMPESFIEYMTPAFEPVDANDKDNFFFMDAGLSYGGKLATIFGGLEHLKNETVQVVADGGVHPDLTVSASGYIVLSRPATSVHAGLYANAFVNPMPLETQRPMKGSTLGTIIRPATITAHFIETLGGAYGSSLDRMDELQFRKGSDRMDVSPPLFTGDFVLPYIGDSSTDPNIYIAQKTPLPMTLAGYAVKLYAS